MSEDVQAMIEDCEKRSGKLTEWELQFIADISERESLTEKQIKKLEKIWDRVTS